MREREMRAMVVGVPCRDEHDHLDGCLTAVRDAADRLPAGVTVAIVVACDSTTDGSERIAQRWAANDPRVSVIRGNWGTPGGARHAACAAGLQRAAASGRRPSETWIATTDADTLVPPDWLSRQLADAHQGADAIAGVVDLRRDEPLDRSLLHAFGGHYALGRHSHRHVHGANLGVRADAYLRAGGFPPVASGEDHALWNALRRAGCRCVSSVGLRVATSARLQGRAGGGFADDLARLAGAAGQPA